MTKWIKIITIILLTITFMSCKNKESLPQNSSLTTSFNPESLTIPAKGGRMLRGQLLYMPIYSNIPFRKELNYDLSAFLAIHNTDLKNQITVTKVDFFNADGKIIKNFISSEQQIKPLATVIITISKEDQSGTGANFLVQWMADQPVNEPLIESIMTGLSGNLGLSFLSAGRIIREVQ